MTFGRWTTMPDTLDVDLLDANLLIALVVEDHVHHGPAEKWSAGRSRPFATCPITQGSLLRFLVREGASGAEARRFLGEVCLDGRHRFWPDDLEYHDVDMAGVVGHRQITDAYLAALARDRGGRLATLDRGLAAIHSDIADLIPV